MPHPDLAPAALVRDRDREVLAAIREGAVHGFEVFARTSLGICDTGPTLARLECEGLIASRADEVDSRQRFSLTAAGCARLEESRW